MHYKNGREAKNGDIVVMVGGPKNIPVAGILYGAVPGIDTCNGMIIGPNQSYPTTACLSDCVHVEDLAAAMATIKDTAAPVPAAADPGGSIPAVTGA